MYGLDIVRMIVPPGPSHSFGVLMVWHNVVVVGELFVTDGTFPVLLDDLPVEELPHLGRRPDFPISSRVRWIIDSLYASLTSRGLGRVSRPQQESDL